MGWCLWKVRCWDISLYDFSYIMPNWELSALNRPLRLQKCIPKGLFKPQLLVIVAGWSSFQRCEGVLIFSLILFLFVSRQGQIKEAFWGHSNYRFSYDSMQRLRTAEIGNTLDTLAFDYQNPILPYLVSKLILRTRTIFFRVSLNACLTNLSFPEVILLQLAEVVCYSIFKSWMENFRLL